MIRAGMDVEKAGRVGRVIATDDGYCRVVWQDGDRSWEDARLLTVKR
jgi:hypothetical protein